MVRIATYEDCS